MELRFNRAEVLAKITETTYETANGITVCTLILDNGFVQEGIFKTHRGSAFDEEKAKKLALNEAKRELIDTAHYEFLERKKNVNQDPVIVKHNKKYKTFDGRTILIIKSVKNDLENIGAHFFVGICLESNMLLRYSRKGECYLEDMPELSFKEEVVETP